MPYGQLGSDTGQFSLFSAARNASSFAFAARVACTAVALATFAASAAVALANLHETHTAGV